MLFYERQKMGEEQSTEPRPPDVQDVDMNS